MSSGGESQFVHLHLHSHYSLLDGMGKVKDIVAKAKAQGSPAIAITDHGVMHGAIEFYDACKTQEIKPIIGCEFYIINGDIHVKEGSRREKPFHLTLLAKNIDGYRNLMQMVTIAHLEGFYYKPRINKEVLAKYKEGLICMSGCLQGEVPRALVDEQVDTAREVAKWHQNLFGDDYYFELQWHPNLPEQEKANQAMLKLAKELGIKVVLTEDAHYVNEDDADAQEVLTCVQTGSLITDPNRFSMRGELFFMQDPEQLYEHFKNNPEMLEALRETARVAEKVNLDLNLDAPLKEKLVFPKFELPTGETANSFLRKEVENGLLKRYGNPVPEHVRKRAEYELGIIEEMGYDPYFLIVADYVNWAKEQGVGVGPGRGSAAGSVVTYAIGITNLEPITYGLLFERFLNPERVSMPDIDVDFADDRREEVIEYVMEKYGRDKVAQIITYGTMASRAAVRDVGRVLGMSYTDVDKIAKMVPPPWQGKHVPLKKILNYDPKIDHFEASDQVGQAIKAAEGLREAYRNDAKAKQLLDLAQKLEGTVRHTSTHAAGVVITDRPLPYYAPMQLSTSAGKTTTVVHYGMNEMERIGLLKMDFLGLKNLSIIKNTLRIVRKTRDLELDIDDIPLDDKKVFSLLSQGLTVGVFQFESGGMTRYLQELKPTVLEDLIAMGALYRPGPIASIPDFIASKHGKKKAVYLDESFKPFLEQTYGVIVYQEQVFEIARVFAGFTYGQADILRKAMGKKIKKLMDEQHDKFIDGAVKLGKTKDLAEKVWKFVEPFASYGFNKSHAACYGMISYQTAYLKANFPPEFMAALLTSDQDTTEKISKNIVEAEAMGLKVLPPSVNESFTDFAVVKGTGNIRFGLNAIKNVGRKISDLIVEERKVGGQFKDLVDFASRVDKDALNKKTLESLIKAGALDDFGERNSLLASMDRISAASKKDTNQLDIFGNSDEIVATKVELVEAIPASDPEKLAWEKELLGTYVSRHPVEDYKDLLAKYCMPISALKDKRDGNSVVVGGMISRLQKVTTRKGELMFFADLQDTDETVEMIIFPGILKEASELLKLDSLVAVQGKINLKDRVVEDGDDLNVESEVKLVVDKMIPLTEETLKSLGPIRNNSNFAQQSDDMARITESGSTITVRLPKSFTNAKLQSLKELISKYPGESQLQLEIFHDGDWQIVPTSTKVEMTSELRQRIALL